MFGGIPAEKVQIFQRVFLFGQNDNNILSLFTGTRTVGIEKSLME
jgi:hypothetical protein